MLVELPNKGLDRHENLRYLLLENNRLKFLPCEIGNLRNLTALNLDNNCLEYPSMEVIANGLKSILDALKKDYVKLGGSNDSGGGENENYDDQSIGADDVWASDADEEDRVKSSAIM